MRELDFQRANTAPIAELEAVARQAEDRAIRAEAVAMTARNAANDAYNTWQAALMLLERGRRTA